MPNTNRIIERPGETKVVVEHASLGQRPAFRCSEVFLVPLVCQGDVDISMEKGELSVSGMVTNPSDGALLGKSVEVVICKSSY